MALQPFLNYQGGGALSHEFLVASMLINNSIAAMRKWCTTIFCRDVEIQVQTGGGHPGPVYCSALPLAPSQPRLCYD